MKTYKAIDIANKLIAKSGEAGDCGELVSNMKLQKLLYYLQGFHLAFFGKPLFEEEIEAWQYGPVVPSVYEAFKSYGNGGISLNEETEVVDLDDQQLELFDIVYQTYGQFSAIGLMNRTHNESPWMSTTRGRGNVISHDKLTNFFKTRIN